MKNNNLDDLIDKQSKELTDRELLEAIFIKLHKIQWKLGSLENGFYWISAMVLLSLTMLLYEFPPLWLR
jgi:hypothetical protein